MESLFRNLAASTKHLRALHDFFIRNDPQYRTINQKIKRLNSYTALAELFYPAIKARQMALSDLLQYALTGRGYWIAIGSAEGKSDFLRLILHTVNLLYIQEGILSSNPRVRAAFLSSLRKSGIPGFLKSRQERDAFEHCRKRDGYIEAHRSDPDYVALDGCLPKSLGNIIELIVYACLIQGEYGYPIPLLTQQRLFKKNEQIVSPDFLLITRDARIFGIEVGQATGRFSLQESKVRQTNQFSSSVSIPVLTALVPPYRCPECNRWLLFCDAVIERFATEGKPLDTHELSCPSCPLFNEGRCAFIIYRGRVKPGGDVRHHHYECVQRIRYVMQVVAVGQKLINYFPHFQGIENLRP
jgi:hypothetical protein